MAKSKKKTILNANNPFHLMIMLITAVYQLIIVTLSWVYRLLVIMFKHWGASLIIAVSILALMYTLGVI